MSAAAIGSKYVYKLAGVEVEVVEQDAVVWADEDEPGRASAAVCPHELRAVAFASVAGVVRERNLEVIALTGSDEGLECVFLKAFEDSLDDGDAQIVGAFCECRHDLSQRRETALMAAGAPTLKAVKKLVPSGEACQSQGRGGRFSVHIKRLGDIEVGCDLAFDTVMRSSCHSFKKYRVCLPAVQTMRCANFSRKRASFGSMTISQYLSPWLRW